MFAAASVSQVIAQLLQKRPFIPFELVVADGRIAKVPSNEQAWIDPDGEIFYLVSTMPAGETVTEIFALRHVAIVRVPERMKPTD